MAKKKFTPQMIGTLPKREIARITDLYKILLKNAEELQGAIEHSLRMQESLSIDLFIESLKEGTEKFIKRKHVEINQINIVGISNQKLMDSDLLDIPLIEETLQKRAEFNKVLSNVEKEGFVYPLRKLYSPETESFQLTEDFYNHLILEKGKFTQNEEQNFVLEKMKNLANVLNELYQYQILGDTINNNTFKELPFFFEIDGTNTEEPFQISRKLFFKGRLNKYRGPFNAKPIKDNFEIFTS